MEKKNILCSRVVELNGVKFVWIISTHSEYLVPARIFTARTLLRHLKSYQISPQITAAMFPLGLSKAEGLAHGCSVTERISKRNPCHTNPINRTDVERVQRPLKTKKVHYAVELSLCL